MSLEIVILAAGKGRRMNSSLPKVLQPLAGRPLLAHVLDAVAAFEGARCHVVYGHGGERVRAALGDRPALQWHLQAEQLGTAHAVDCAMPAVADNATVLVLYGDVPLVRHETLVDLVAATEARDAPAHSAGSHGAFTTGHECVALLTLHTPAPTGYGRIVRDAAGQVLRIVEEKDADDATRRIQEVNTGVLACNGGLLRRWLARIDNRNVQGEFYLTDIVGLAVADGVPVTAVSVADASEVLGVNDRLQLAEVEAAWRRRAARRLLESGVTLADPARIDVRGALRCGRDVFIDVNCVFEGNVDLGDDVHIGPGVCLRDCHLAAGTRVLAHSVLEGADVAGECTIGPFARVRPGTVLGHGARIGNFVEVKKSHVGHGTKVNHLSYIGDADIGSEVNVGCGTVTCNYDGQQKHLTVIEDGAFIGSGSMLVAPVTIGAGGYIGSGSTITRNAPAGELTVARARQVTVPNWKPPGRKGEGKE